jgi:hypothetical protein
MVEKKIYEVFKESGHKVPKVITECIEDKQDITLSIRANNLIWWYERKGYIVNRIDYHATSINKGYNIVFKKRIFRGFHRQQDY